MLQITDMFSMIGQDGCSDVASSLAMQGCVVDIHIPIYEIFYLDIMFGDKCGFLASHLNEFTALRKLATDCGAVTVTINVLDLQILTLLGAVCIFTPNTGMSLFLKECITDLTSLTEDIAEQVVSLSGLPLNGLMSTDLLEDAIHVLFDKLVDLISDSCAVNGINVYHWEQLPEFYNEISMSGEMQEMHNFRAMVGAAVF